MISNETLEVTTQKAQDKATRKAERKARWTANLAAAKEQREARTSRPKVNRSSGALNSQIVCPQCQVRGKVQTKEVKNKVGISGGKATAAVLTVGWSMLATGLSRKQQVTQAHCGNCNSTWTF